MIAPTMRARGTGQLKPKENMHMNIEEQSRYDAVVQVLRDLVSLVEPGASPAVAEACRIAKEITEAQTQHG
jgi:hypothetical protein